MEQLSRRMLLRAGLGAGALALLGGCSSGTSARRPGVRVTPGTASGGSAGGSDWEFVSHKPEWLRGGGGAVPAAGHPGVMSRASWTRAQPKMWDANPMGRVSRITIHHDGMSPFVSTSAEAAAQRLEAIRQAHVGANGWADIGYHYVVDPAGRVWEARPVNLQGAHVKDNNEQNIGVMVLGNYEQQSPTNASTKSMEDFVASLMRRHRVPVGRVYTHQELRATACPGRSLQRVMESTRSRGGTLARA